MVVLVMRRVRLPAIGLLLGFVLLLLLYLSKNDQPISHNPEYEHDTHIIKSNEYEIGFINITSESHNIVDTFKSEDGTYITSSEAYETELTNNPSLPSTSDKTYKYDRTSYDDGWTKFTDESYDSLDSSKFLWDNSRKYLWRGFVKTGSAWKEVSSEWRVCLATQASVEHLFWLAHHAQVWKGPISVSVYAPDNDYTVAVHMIEYLQQCFTQVRELVSFHFLYPPNAPPNLIDIQYNVNLFTCEDSENFNRFLVDNLRDKEFKDFLTDTLYPQNLLRNIARQGCPSEYAITSDMDMLAVEGMSQDLNTFLMKSEIQTCVKCAYVVPVYEIVKNVTRNPRNKAQLLQLVKNDYARQFHVKVFKPNQENSDLKKWESLDPNLSLDVAYNISQYRNQWEPIYVAKANIPPFNERFVGYGFTRNTQVYEMELNGYKWKMLTNAFLCHRGFQTTGSYSSQRRSQISKNREQFLIYRREMLIRYNKSVEAYPLYPTPKNKSLPINYKAKKKQKVTKTIGSIKPINHKNTISKSTKDESKVFVNFVPI
ncbi:unnamed protein product [Meganyctiphanes norvegica]|uniref:Beta-1,4-glucuronyltransferase 1 n=1 Tax=Meganyctiphanes norvegica TaxID=48144 RepID=A0AAV2RN73_MEGNR